MRRFPISLSRPSSPRRPRRSMRPGFEPLEGRAVLTALFDSVLTVGNDTAAIVPTDSAVDSAGNTYVIGSLQAPMDFDPANVRADGSDILTPRGTSDAYVVKYNADNSFAWARSMGGDYVRQSNLDLFEKADGVDVDAAGNVFVSGTFYGQADFGPIRLTSAGDADAFVVKFNSSGTTQWARSWGSADQDSGNELAVDPSGNAVAVGTSAFADSVPGWIANTSQIRKFSPTGALVWSRTFAGPTGGAYVVSTDAAGSVYVGGRFSGTVDFNPDAKKVNSLSGNYGSGYVLKLTSAGAYAWASALQTRATTAPYGSAMTIFDIAVDTGGNVVIGGGFQGNIDFNPSATGDYQLSPVRTINGFVARLTSTGAFSWANATGSDGVRAVAVDTTGAVYVTGYYAGGGFTPGFGQPAVATRGQTDGFLSKYTSSGVLSWALTYGGTGSEGAYGLDVALDGTITLVGFYGPGTSDFDPDPLGTQERTNTAFNDLFILKLRQN